MEISRAVPRLGSSLLGESIALPSQGAETKAERGWEKKKQGERKEKKKGANLKTLSPKLAMQHLRFGI
jgi:hypothetical protein